MGKWVTKCSIFLLLECQVNKAFSPGGCTQWSRSRELGFLSEPLCAFLDRDGDRETSERSGPHPTQLNWVKIGGSAASKLESIGAKV